MKGFILYLTAQLLKHILFPIGYWYAIFKLPKKERDKFHEENAIAIDKWGNVFLAPLFNRTMITKEGYQFGNSDETISSVMGKNVRMETLTKAGRLLNAILNKIDPNHAIKSIEENP